MRTPISDKKLDIVADHLKKALYPIKKLDSKDRPRIGFLKYSGQVKYAWGSYKSGKKK